MKNDNNKCNLETGCAAHDNTINPIYLILWIIFIFSLIYGVGQLEVKKINTNGTETSTTLFKAITKG